MKLIAILFFALTLVVEAQDVSFERIVRYHGLQSGHKIEVVIHQGEFDFTDYKLSGGTEASEEPAKINGVQIAGTDSRSPAKIKGWPKIETITAIELKWNGKPVIVPNLLHINLLNLSLSPGSIQFIPSPNGEALLIQATGGDGGGSYLTSLVLRMDGKHEQHPYVYCESGLPEYPYLVETEIGRDKQGKPMLEARPWLKQKLEAQGGSGTGGR